MQTTFQRTFTTLMTSAILALGAGLGCDAETVEEEAGELAFRPGGGGGWNLNTGIINGEVPLVSLTGGLDPNPDLYVLTGAELGSGVALDSVGVDEGELVGFIGKARYGGDDLSGAQLHFNSTANGAMTLHFEHGVDSRGASLYVIEVDDGSSSEPHKLCAPDSDPGGHYGAYLLGDVVVSESGDLGTTAGMMYMACTSGAVGKARQWGYDPEDIGLDNLETVIRGIRADYCGDGVSHTFTGSPIMIWDFFGVSQPDTTWAIHEGDWNENGLVCRGSGQRTSVIYPSCYYEKPACGGGGIGEVPAVRTFVSAIK